MPMNPEKLPAGSGVPDRAGGVPPYLSELCRDDAHARCRHPANAGRADGCECPCHELAELAASWGSS